MSIQEVISRRISIRAYEAEPASLDDLEAAMRQQDREGKDYHRLDCGIAMCHLHLTARELGIKGYWELGSFEVPGASGAEPVGRYIFGEQSAIKASQGLIFKNFSVLCDLCGKSFDNTSKVMRRLQ